MNQTFSFTNTKTGEIIRTSLRRDQAVALLREMPNRGEFINSLLAKCLTLSGNQAFWLYKKAEDYKAIKEGKTTQKPQGLVTGEGMKRIYEMFIHATNSGLKKPRIKLKDNEDNKITLSYTGNRGANPDHIYVKLDERGGYLTYCGKINNQGVFFPKSECPTSIKNYLQEFSNNPANIAKAYGDRTGNCCFCGLELTDSRSVNAGYGPICAGHYNLPWG